MDWKYYSKWGLYNSWSYKYVWYIQLHHVLCISSCWLNLCIYPTETGCNQWTASAAVDVPAFEGSNVSWEIPEVKVVLIIHLPFWKQIIKALFSTTECTCRFGKKSRNKLCYNTTATIPCVTNAAGTLQLARLLSTYNWTNRWKRCTSTTARKPNKCCL